jgi:hypothetical protein
MGCTADLDNTPVVVRKNYCRVLASFCSDTRESMLGVGCSGSQRLDFSRSLISRGKNRVTGRKTRAAGGFEDTPAVKAATTSCPFALERSYWAQQDF